MIGVQSVYLGWNNPRTAIKMQKVPVVILVEKEKWKVLENEVCDQFIAEIVELTHHLCGVKSSQSVEDKIKILGEGNAAYDDIFDRYFK